MSLLKSYSSELFLGSERKAPALPNHAGELGDLCQKIMGSNDAVETQILRIAASLHLYSQAGYTPSRANPLILEKSLTEEYQAITDENLMQAFQQIIEDGPVSLMHIPLITLIQKQTLLAPGLLPAVFDLAIQSPEIKPYLPKVMGNRGRWLLKAHPEWNAQLFADDQLKDEDWQEGSFQQSIVYIQQLRALDANKARELIAARLPELDARQRSELIEATSIQLSASDESFLESLLKDRSKEVRNKAANFLTLIPDSQFVHRAGSRMAPLLIAEKKLFRKHWSIDIPDQFNAAWAQDTIEEKRPQSESLGQKAWWFYQMVLTLPLHWWEKTLEFSAKDCLQWAKESDWQEALLRAWHEACLREKNSTWAEAFLQMGSTKNFNLDITRLIDCLALPKRQDWWLSLLKDKYAQEHRQAIISWICHFLVQEYQNHQQLNSLALQDSFLQKLMSYLSTYLFSSESRWDYVFRPIYLQMLCLIPQSVLSETIKLWPTQVEPNSATEELLAKAHRIVRIRTLFHQLAVSKEL